MIHILKATNIHKSYTLGGQKLEVLRGLDLSVEAGQFVAIIGASGSGKSTLLHILGALDSPDKGSVEFETKRLDKFSSGKLNKFRNATVGFVFQFYHLLDELTVLENVILPAMASCSVLGWLGRRNSVKKRGKMLIEMMGLDQRIAHKPYQLSGGERQRVAVARAVINQPQLLLADEPTGNLDSETGNGILEILGRMHQDGQTIIMVTHDERIAAKADKVIRLVDGKVVEAQ
jgi:lipoprotein-releasing system ATP-binding protein